MKMKLLITVVGLLALAAGSPALGQTLDTTGCMDKVYLKYGNLFRGKIVRYIPDSLVVLQSWNGTTMYFPAKSVKRVEQYCPEKGGKQEYRFREHGVYNALRMSFLAGQVYWGENQVGVSLVHSIGWSFSRLLAVGVGGGVEYYSPDDVDAVTYPVFAECRGYLLRNRTTPFYTLVAGWAWTGLSNNANLSVWETEKWKGGWMAKAQLGLRIGHHFSVQGGLSFQQKIREKGFITSETRDVYTYLHKRAEFGIGFIF